MNLKERAKQLSMDMLAVMIAMKDRETPFPAKLFAGLAVGYMLSPVDLIPDFIPVLGYLDDVILVPALIALAIKMIPAHVWMRSKEAAAKQRQNGRAKKWQYAIPIVLIWLLFLWIIIKAVWL